MEFEAKKQDVTDLRLFLRDAVGFGALWETLHSSKSKEGGRRIKFYLNPILCPRFQLPEAKTKEPYYWNMSDLFDLAKKAKVTISRERATQSSSANETLFFPEFRSPVP